jgi:ribA/ribD-fused uncharacterized protein
MLGLTPVLSKEEIMAVRQFRGANRFLSNFYGLHEEDVPLAILFEGLVFPTVEHAYVAAKVTDLKSRLTIQTLPTPSQAKKYPAQHGLTVRPDWPEIKLKIMENLLRQKFSVLELRTMLLATGDELLQEGNDWGDTFWGVDLATGQGQNHLGRLLMKIRRELRAR